MRRPQQRSTASDLNRLKAQHLAVTWVRKRHAAAELQNGRCQRAHHRVPEWPLPENSERPPPHHEKTSMTQHRTAVWCLLQDSLLYFARKLRPAARRPQRTRQPGTPHGLLCSESWLCTMQLPATSHTLLLRALVQQMERPFLRRSRSEP